MLHLAQRAFFPARIPFPVMHVDTGHNFEEVIEFRDRTVKQFEVDLLIASVEEAIARGRVRDVSGFGASRNTLQTVALLDAIAEQRFDAVFGGARRDEERARAKERVVSHRDEFGQWDPKNQRPELWGLYNTRHHRGEHVRVFPLSNWTELDIWRFIAERGRRTALAVLRPRARGVPPRRDADGRQPARRPPPNRDAVHGDGELSHDRRCHLHGSGGVVGGDGRRHPRRDGLGPPHRAGSDASRRPHLRGRHGGSQAPRAISDGDAPPVAKAPLHFATIGSVDDGKSTLIGRLLHDSKSIFEDQLEHIEAVSKRRGNDYVDLALLTDGLRAEREQGITIDVAYRYFSTPRRDFVIADCPGHVQYTRNMITGVSRADLAIVLVDARHGIVEQTRRHTLDRRPVAHPATRRRRQQDGSRRLRRAAVRRASATASSTTPRRSASIADAVAIIPISALTGENVVERSRLMPWYSGPTLLEHLETVEVVDARDVPARFPVQYVIRPQRAEHRDYRGYAGTVAAGVSAHRRHGRRAAIRHGDDGGRDRHRRRSDRRGGSRSCRHGDAGRRRRRVPRRRDRGQLGEAPWQPRS